MPVYEEPEVYSCNRRNTYVKTPPSKSIVSVEEARKFCKQDFTYDDDIFKIIINTATSMVQNTLRRSILSQTLVLELDTFPFDRYIILDNGKATAINSFTYINTDGNTQTYSASGNYSLDTTSLPSVIHLEPGKNWPFVMSEKRSAIQIEYVAGYSTVDTIPKEILSATLYLIKHLYDNRDLIIVGNDARAIEVPKTLEWLLWPLRDFRW